MSELTLSLHLNSFPNNTDERKRFHLEEVHQTSEMARADEVNDFHRELHLTEPCHGFKKGVVNPAAVR